MSNSYRCFCMLFTANIYSLQVSIVVVSQNDIPHTIWINNMTNQPYSLKTIDPVPISRLILLLFLRQRLRGLVDKLTFFKLNTRRPLPPLPPFNLIWVTYWGGSAPGWTPARGPFLLFFLHLQRKILTIIFFLGFFSSF